MRRVDTSDTSRDPLAAVALASGDGQQRRQQWWAAEEVPVDPLAARLDFVFSEAEAEAAAAPGAAGPSAAPGLRWDNNAGADFHTHVAGALEGEALVDAVLSATGLGKEEGTPAAAALAAAAAAAAAEAAKARATAASARRRRTAQTLFTLPFPPRAGRPCTLYYDPSGSVLKGRTEVAAKGGWNRGRHATCFAPARMRPAVPGGGGGGWLRSEEALDVPLDAWSLDAFVSDAATGPGGARGGFSDDAKGSQYHLPVVAAPSGSSGASAAPPRPPSLRIAHVAVEAAPAAKVGGMADVVTALARAARDLGHDARIVLPKFDCLDYSSLRGLAPDAGRDFWVGSTKVAVWNASLLGVPTVLLEPQDGSVW
jgi:starch synthase